MLMEAHRQRGALRASGDGEGCSRGIERGESESSFSIVIDDIQVIVASPEDERTAVIIL